MRIARLQVLDFELEVAAPIGCVRVGTMSNRVVAGVNPLPVPRARTRMEIT